MHPPILVAIIMANVTVFALAVGGMVLWPNLPGKMTGGRFWAMFGWLWLVFVFAYKFVI